MSFFKGSVYADNKNNAKEIKKKTLVFKTCLAGVECGREHNIYFKFFLAVVGIKMM